MLTAPLSCLNLSTPPPAPPFSPLCWVFTDRCWLLCKGNNFLWLLLLCFLNPFKILAKVFSRGALESYLPRLQDVVKSEIAKWCSKPGSIDVYAAAKSLTFRIAVRVLLGLQLEEERIVYLAKIFEQLMNNLFSLPIDAPLSGLRKVRQHENKLFSVGLNH